jgi:hypothetical protein
MGRCEQPMLKLVLLLNLFSLTGAVNSDVPATEFLAPQAIQDSKTKVIYCCEVLNEKESKEYHHYVANILVNPDKDFISVGIWVVGFRTAWINKKTGAIRYGREVS